MRARSCCCRRCSLLAAARASPRRASGQTRTVNVYNWSDYVEPTVIEAFTKETGIKVRYDTFDSNETLETKLLAGKSGYDVVVPTAYFLERQITAGVFQKLDKSKLTNLGNVWPEIAQAARGLRSWQSVRRQLHVGHDGHRLQRQEGPRGSRSRRADRGAMASWDIVFKPENLAKFKDCGVHMLDSSDDILPAALHYPRPRSELHAAGRSRKGRRSGDQGPAERAQIQFVGISQCARVRRNLPGGRLVGRHQAGAEARAPRTRGGVEIGYAIPKGGAQMFFDNFAIPKDAKNVAEAHAFIDYMLRPEVAAKNSNFLGYANGNLASQQLLDKAVLDDRTVYPDAETMKSLYIITAHDQKTQRLMNRLWTKVKTGR